MLCKYCGKEIPDSTTVCPYCGKQLEERVAIENDLTQVNNISDTSSINLKDMFAKLYDIIEYTLILCILTIFLIILFALVGLAFFAVLVYIVALFVAFVLQVKRLFIYADYYDSNKHIKYALIFELAAMIILTIISIFISNNTNLVHLINGASYGLSVLSYAFISQVVKAYALETNNDLLVTLAHHRVILLYALVLITILAAGILASTSVYRLVTSTINLIAMLFYFNLLKKAKS